jgi:DNA invertase Pin-like site-specific DNA recombinase
MKQRNYATGQLKALRTLAINSDYMEWMHDLKGRPVVIYARDSNNTQLNNLRHQEAGMIAAAKKLGCSIVEVVSVIAPGWEDERDWEQLRRAIRLAKATTGAVVFAEAVNRFTRGSRRCPGEEDKKNGPLKEDLMRQLTVHEMERLKAEADGVTLATLWHPNTPPKEVHSLQTKRGQEGTGNKGGRPKIRSRMRERRLRLTPEAVSLRESGHSFREIARQLRVRSWSTICDWIERDALEKSAHLEAARAGC